MKNSRTRLLALATAAALLATSLPGYNLLTETGTPVKWPDGSVGLRIQADNTAVLFDGTTLAGSIQQAALTWNTQINKVQFAVQIAAAGSGIDHNHINEVFFASTPYGFTWDENTLAITTEWVLGSTRTEADIIFNTAITWNSYRGPMPSPFLASSAIDVRRVALHELGHVLGLDHPDEATPPQVVVAVMNSTVSDTDSLQADDIAGAQVLYGSPQVAPTVVVGPQSATIVAGQGTFFNAAATGSAPLQYQWQRLAAGGSTWTNLADGGNFSNTATYGLSISGATLDMNGDQYRCVVTNSFGTATSGAVSLTVTPATKPSLQDLPATRTVDYGAQLSLSSAIASGTGPIDLVWSKDGINLPNTGDVNFIKAYMTTADAGVYTLTATNAAGTAAVSCTVTVNAPVPPAIGNLPLTDTINFGGSLYYQPTVTGTRPMNLRWQKNGVDIPGATDQSFPLNYSSATPADSGSYTLVATNLAGTASATIAITVLPAPPTVIGNLPATMLVYEGQAVFLTPTVTGYAPWTFQWEKDGVPIAGATAQSYNKVVTRADSGVYRLRATNAVGTATSGAITITVRPLPEISMVTASGFDSLCLASDGGLLAFGRDDFGQLGSSSGQWVGLLATATDVAAVATGYNTTFFVKSDGSLWAMGSDYSGQFGNGLNALSPPDAVLSNFTPLQVASGVVSAVAGSGHSLVLKLDGSLWAAGSNHFGQLGDGSTTDHLTLEMIAQDVAFCAAGGTYSMFIKFDGTLWAMGHNDFGQLATGDKVDRTVPVQVAAGVVSVACGYAHSVFLKADGTLWGIGTNSYGQLGFAADASGHPQPTLIASGVATAAASDNNVFYVTADGVLYGIGDSSSWQLAGTNSSYSVPQLIDSGVASVAAGILHAIYLKTDGSVWGLGSSAFGQLGGDAFGQNRYVRPREIIHGAALAPAKPASPSVTTRSSGVLLSWLPTIGAANYEVWRGASSSFAAATRLATGVPVSLYCDATAGSQKYFYWVKAINAGGATLSDPSRLFVPDVPADFNGDGKADLVWQNLASGARRLWLMDGVTRSANVDLGVVPAEWVIAATADFDGDGQADVVWENTATGQRSVWLMNGTAFRSGLDLGIVPVDWEIAAVADFDGDGHPDLVWENTATGQRSIWLMNGTTFAGGVDLGVVPPDWLIVGAEDFNHDGSADLVWQNRFTGQASLWLMTGTSFLAGIDLGNNSAAMKISAVGDYNGDGQADLVWTDETTGQRMVWLMHGTVHADTAVLGTDTTDWSIGVPRAAPPAAAHVNLDFNSDGKSDLLWQNTTTGQRAIWLMNGTTFLSGVDLGMIPTNWVITTTGDFNGDGKPDLVWENTTTGQRAIWLMNGTSFLSGVDLGTVPIDWVITATGDFNGDGKTDLVWTNTTTGQRSIWLMNGSAFAGGVDLGVVPPAWSLQVTGDFNGDGKTDLLWQNTATGQRAIWLMNGTTFSAGVDLGIIPTDWRIVAVGDYNGDGKPDLVWQNNFTGQRSIWLMNGATFLSGVDLGIVPVEWRLGD